jgi:hypothetical protein
MKYFNDIQAPKLVEPGARYFFYNTLKNINIKKSAMQEISLNVFYFALFVSILGIFLVYKYKTKLTPEEIKKKRDDQRVYLINKMKDLSYKEQVKQNKLITNLPKFESDFVLMHKNYYNV